MLRKTFVSIAVSSALYVSSSYALELGELTSQSSLDEPYRGRIELSDVGNLTVDDILIRLGSESEFRQAGLLPTSILSKLKFNVVQERGEVVVTISSEQPLLADELHFVLAARWPSGQIVREYQVPLNPSSLVEKGQEDIVQAPTSDAINSLPRSGSDSSGAAFRQAQLTAQSASKAKENVWNVEKGNTLWSIASKNPIANQLTIYQTMMAIQALNRDAFYSDNINLLKEGSVLRLPTEDQIKLFNKAASEKEFLRQHEAWLAFKNSAGKNASNVDKAQLNTQAKAKGTSSGSSLKEDKLTLASGQSLLPENVASSNTGEGSSAALDALKTELSATQETLDKEQREKEELSSQLNDLNEQLTTLEELIQLKDKQMAELQQQFVESQKIIEEQREMVDQLLEADQIRREQEEAEASSLVNKIFKNPIILSIGALVLMLLGFLTGFVLRRSNKIEEEFESLKKDEFDLSDTSPPIAQTNAADDEYIDEDDVIDDDFMEMEDDVVEDDSEEDAFQEEDPFAFDFDGQSDTTEELDADDFSSFEADDIEEDVDDTIDPDSELESAIDALAETDDEDFGAFEGDGSDDEVIDEDDIPTITQEENIDVEEPEVEEVDEIEFAEAPEIQTDEVIEDTIESDLDREEESFVSNLLNDDAQDDVDESSIFNEAPSDALANSIEETLAEAQDEQEIEVPEFTEEQAAATEESSDEEEEFDFFDASGDEVATKLDLARAYMDMGDEEGARVILEDVIGAGNEAQIAEAQTMIERMFPSD